MLPDRVSNPGPLTYESGALLIALWGAIFFFCYDQYTHIIIICFGRIHILFNLKSDNLILYTMAVPILRFQHQSKICVSVSI